MEGTLCAGALRVHAGATRGVTSEICPAGGRAMSADVPDDGIAREGAETFLRFTKRILEELRVEVSLGDPCCEHFQNWMYLFIIQGSSGLCTAGQGRDLPPTEFLVGQTGKGSDRLL